MDPLKGVKIKRIDSSSRKKWMKVLTLLAFIFVLWAIVMNLIINYIIPLHTTIAHASQGGINYELAIDKTNYSAGEPIQLKLIVQNTSKNMIILHFSTTQRYNFVVKRDIDFIFFHFPIDVWQASYHNIPHPISNELKLMPGEKQTFQDKWDQKNAKGQQVPTGRYIISAYLTNAGSKTILELPAKMQR